MAKPLVPDEFCGSGSNRCSHAQAASLPLLGPQADQRNAEFLLSRPPVSLSKLLDQFGSRIATTFSCSSQFLGRGIKYLILLS